MQTGSILGTSVFNNKRRIHQMHEVPTSSVADPHHFHADPDPNCHFDADPDPTLHFHADPDPSFQVKAQNLEKVLK
jgi:hypothetical protein